MSELILIHINSNVPNVNHYNVVSKTVVTALNSF